MVALNHCGSKSDCRKVQVWALRGGGFKRENKLGARGWEGGNSCRVVASSFLFINHEMRLLVMLNVLLLSL